MSFVKIGTMTHFNKDVNQFLLYIPYFSAVMEELSIESLHAMPSSNCEVHERQCCERHAFVNEFLSRLAIFIVRFGFGTEDFHKCRWKRISTLVSYVSGFLSVLPTFHFRFTWSSLWQICTLMLRKEQGRSHFPYGVNEMTVTRVSWTLVIF
jgi:hypothetical protein